MKQIRVHRFGGPEQLKYEEVAPLCPGAGEVLVRIEAVGVNPVDTYIRSGMYGERPLPYTPGTDAAGVVAETSGDWAEGTRVYLTGSLSGTYAEYALCKPETLFRLPERASFAQGAGLFVPYTTAHRALFGRGGGRPGEWVLVHGASGGVGLAAVQLARAAGLRVIGTAGTDEGLEAVRQNGAHVALNHREPNYLEEIVRASEGQGPALILEMLANVNLQKDLEIVARLGRIVVIGSRGSLEFTPRGAMGKDVDIRGLMLFNTPTDELRAIQNAIQAGLEAGFLAPVVGRQFGLGEAAEAHKAVLEPGALGKIVLLPEH